MTSINDIEYVHFQISSGGKKFSVLLGSFPPNFYSRQFSSTILSMSSLKSLPYSFIFVIVNSSSIVLTRLQSPRTSQATCTTNKRKSLPLKFLIMALMIPWSNVFGIYVKPTFVKSTMLSQSSIWPGSMQFLITKSI